MQVGSIELAIPKVRRGHVDVRCDAGASQFVPVTAWTGRAWGTLLTGYSSGFAYPRILVDRRARSNVNPCLRRLRYKPGWREVSVGV